MSAMPMMATQQAEAEPERADVRIVASRIGDVEVPKANILTFPRAFSIERLRLDIICAWLEMSDTRVMAPVPPLSA